MLSCAIRGWPKVYRVFPNPASGQQSLVIESNKDSRCTIELYDIMGRFIKTVYNAKLYSGSTRITHDISSLPNSMYIYIVRLNDKVHNIKFIKG